MTPFTPFGLEPSDEYFLELLTGSLVSDGFIPEFNQSLALEWYEKERREHVIRERFPGRSVIVQWFNTPRFSDRTRVIYKNYDPSTPAEIMVCDGRVEYETPFGGPDAGEYTGVVQITDATFCIHWLPERGDVTALLSDDCSPEVMDREISLVL